MMLPRKFALVVALLLVSSLSWSDASLIPAAPQLGAKSWILLDAHSGRVITEHNADESLQPASLVKLMTSYVLAYWLDQGMVDYDDQVTISENAWAQNPVFRGSSLMWLEVGSEVSLRELHKGVVVSSGNDACVAVAEHIAGSEDSFVDIMNRHARRLGLDNTHFANSHGLTDDEQKSTARDIATLTERLLDFPEAYELHSIPEYTYNNITTRNRNGLLHRDPTVDGVKTGHTASAGYNLVSSAERDGMRLIAVVMGANSQSARERESQRLLSYGFRYYETHRLFDGGEELSRARVWQGKADEVALGVEENIYQTIPRGMDDRVEASIDIERFITAPFARGAPLGELVVKLDGEELARKPLVALEGVESGGLLRRLWHAIMMFVLGLFE